MSIEDQLKFRKIPDYIKETVVDLCEHLIHQSNCFMKHKGFDAGDTVYIYSHAAIALLAQVMATTSLHVEGKDKYLKTMTCLFNEYIADIKGKT